MLPELFETLSADTVRVSLPLVAPELLLAAAIVAMLVARIASATRRIDPFWIAATGVLAALVAVLREAPDGLAAVPRQELFTGLLVHDGLGVFSRGLLLLLVAYFLPLVKLTGLANRDDSQDLFTLVLGAALGMCLMTRANHLLTVFLAVEMASVPSYVLVGIVKGRRRAGEAALKYSVYGAAAAGVMLYGLSLVAGVLGAAHLPTLAERLATLDAATQLTTDEGRGVVFVLTLGAVLLFVGLAFKLAAAPFHFWAPDVFAGAPAEVGAFLSTASKGAALVLTLRLIAAATPHEAALFAAAQGEAPAVRAVLASDPGADGDDATANETPAAGPADPVRAFVATLLAAAAALTCTLGNLAAYGQQNAKRLLAYSTIAHAGYLMTPLAAAAALAGVSPRAAEGAVAAMLFYAAGYFFLNLTAFAVVALVRNARGTEAIDDYAGLARTLPVAAAALAVAALGLLGLPPLVGFFGKLGLLRSLAEAGGPAMTTLLVVVVLNTAVSLVYYLRIVRLACVDAPPGATPPVTPLSTMTRVWLAAAATPIVLLGLFPEPLARLAADAARGVFG